MFRDLINKGRDFADKLTNMVMNYTEAETKVREATNDEPWGPHGQLMMQIADLTFSHGTYLEVMCTLWNRLHADASRGWRRTYKSLVLLEFLLKNGSDQVAPGARENIYDLRGLESFHFIDDNGKDQGINVRIKVQEIIDLLQDPERLEAERSKAKVNSRIYSGHYASDRMEWNSSSSHRNRVTRHWRSSSRDSFDDGDNDVHSNQERWAHLSSPKAAHPPNRLGNFDDWHLGRERGIVDEVVDHMREAWDVAKITTRDLFIQRDSDVHPNESNPRMVSEELYQFPDCAVEVDGAFMRNSPDHSPEEFELPEPVHHEERPKFIPPKDHRGAPPSSSKLQVTMLESRPQVPQASLIASSDTCASNNADLLNLDGPLDSASVWTAGNGTNLPSVLTPISLCSSTNLGPHESTSVSVKSSGGVLDADFGDFASAHGQTSRLTTTSASLGLIDFSSVQPVPSATPTDTTWPEVAPTPANSQAPVSLFADNIGSSVANLSSLPAEPNPKARTKMAVGSTWKELDSLGIDLDTLAMPSKSNPRQATGPSLRQLQRAGKPDSSGTTPFLSAHRIDQQPILNRWQSGLTTASCQLSPARMPGVAPVVPCVGTSNATNTNLIWPHSGGT